MGTEAREDYEFDDMSKKENSKSDLQIDQSTEELIQKDSRKLLYSLETSPPWYMCILLGFQVKNVCIINNIIEGVRSKRKTKLKTQYNKKK